MEKYITYIKNKYKITPQLAKEIVLKTNYKHDTEKEIKEQISLIMKGLR